VAYCRFDVVLKKLRKQHKLTQQELGSKLGVSKAVISKYETGLGYPSLDLLILFSEFFGVTTDYLLGIEGSQHISVDGLTNNEVCAVQEIVNEFRKYNK